MKQEDKNLLLKDLCGRLPYGVKVHLVYDENTKDIREMGLGSLHDIMFDNAEGKPYLRPMSSMTDEEWIKFYKWANCRIEKDSGEIGSKSRGFGEGYEYLGIDDMSDVIDWLNAHHFDFRNLIEKGLAIDCTGLNIY